MATELSAPPSARERLAQWIERSRISQAEAARLIRIDPTQLSQILGGKRRPGLDNAVKIEEKTGIQPQDWVPSPLGDEPTIEPATDSNLSNLQGVK